MECLISFVLVSNISLRVDCTDLYLYPCRVLFLFLFVTVVFFLILVVYFYFSLSIVLSRNYFVEQSILSEASIYFTLALSLNYEFHR